MARARKPPETKLSRQPVTGTFRPRPEAAAATPHHEGWDRALDAALANVGRPRGRYQVQVVFSAVVDVRNPGNIVEYQATVI